MKRKYYLRGLGIGIFFTALILGVSFSNRKGISDEEVIKRAKELGLVESTYLNNVATKPEQEPQESEPKPEPESKPEESMEAELTKEPETEPESTEPESTEPESTEPESTEPESTEPEESVTEEPVETEDEFVTLEIVRGDSSTKVAQKLEELGVIEDYKAFDRFLGKNGYDKRIIANTYQIPKNATKEDIAKIITK